MAELLVRAKKHWMDDLSTTDVEKLDDGGKEGYGARTQIGDIVVVRPDGWEWGREEGLPTFIVVKLPGISVATVEKFQEQLNKDVDYTLTMDVPKEIWDSDTAKTAFLTEKRFKATPSVTATKADAYTVSGQATKTVMAKRRKYRIPETWVKTQVDAVKSVIEIKNASAKTALIESVIEKTS